MKLGLSELGKPFIRMMIALGQGQNFWFFPKPMMVTVKAASAPNMGRKPGIAKMEYL